MTGTVSAVCVVHADVPFGRRGVVDSGIDKRPVHGPVDVHELGIGGDHCRDTKFHGGLDQAVYAYDEAEARYWADQLGAPVEPGRFGENLRTSGVPVTDAVIGTRWRIGTVTLEATIARKPCGTFARWMGEPGWVRRFTARGDVGAYFRVLGSSARGDGADALRGPGRRGDADSSGRARIGTEGVPRRGGGAEIVAEAMTRSTTVFVS